MTDSVNSYQSSTIVVDTMPMTQQVEAQHALPTPENTPASTQPEEASAPPQALPQAPPRARPRQKIVGDVGELNIVGGTGARKPSKRHQAYLTDLAQPDKLLAYHSAFTLAPRLATLECTRMTFHHLLERGRSYRAIGMARNSKKPQGQNIRALKDEGRSRSCQKRQISRLFF